VTRTSAPPDPFVVTLFGRSAIAGDEQPGALAPTLLSLLAVRANDPIDFDVRLRRALAPTDADLETLGTAYRLNADPATVDALALDQLVGDPGDHEAIEECNPDPRLIPRDDSWLFGMSMAASAAWMVDE
jgi:hypothetical protein